MCLLPFFSFRIARNVTVFRGDELPPYRPIESEPIQPVIRAYKYTFDIPSAGTMTVNARTDGTLIFHHIPSTRPEVSHGRVMGSLNGDNLAGGLIAEQRQEKLAETKLRLQEARANFQESMDRLNQELTLVKDHDSVTLVDDEEAESLVGDQGNFKDNDCKDLVKI